jgi:hypothetical protein
MVLAELISKGLIRLADLAAVVAQARRLTAV